MKENFINTVFKEFNDIIMSKYSNIENNNVKDIIIHTFKSFNAEIAKNDNSNKSNFFKASQKVINIINNFDQDDINKYNDDEIIIVQNAFTNANMCIRKHMDKSKKYIMDMIANRPVKRKIEDMSKEELVAYIKENML